MNAHKTSYPKLGVGVIVKKGNKILLGKRKNGHGEGLYATPGGHLEFQETVQDCAIRELAEETGLKSIAWKFGPWTQNFIMGDLHYITLFVIVTEFEGEPLLLEPHKCEGWNWYDWNNLPTPLFPTIHSLLEICKHL